MNGYGRNIAGRAILSRGLVSQLPPIRIRVPEVSDYPSIDVKARSHSQIMTPPATSAVRNDMTIEC